ncbi:hypothetical protein [Pedobacter nyackensis]|uniref:hypothetical protein n=1 Tax=Pedobacter nyackensis TaxID=475255 RepID=UPI00292DBC9F|nr:hypothetical protein [Pedobacter nyackensis]
MKLIKIMIACFIFTLALTFASCKKAEYSSRDTSGIVPEPVIPEPVDPTLVVFDNCENATGWDAAGGASLDPSSKKEGENSIKATIGGGDALRMQKALAQPIDTKLTKETGQLIFWLFVEDAGKVKLSDGQIEVTSSGVPDQQEFNWPTSALNPLQTGWNLVKLKLADAGESGGGADLSKINFFRIYMNTTAAASPAATFTMALDAIGFSAASSTPSNFVPFLNCDVFDEELWEISGGSGKLDAVNKKEGAGALFGKTHPTGGYLHMKLKKALTPAIRTNVTKLTGQLSFWLYLDKVVPLGGQIEITSSGEPDKKEYNWDPSKITGLKPNAWNLVKLNLRDAAVSDDGAPDLNAINFFRMYLETGEDGINIGIDDIKFGAIPPPDDVMFDNADVKDGWETVGEPVIEISSPRAKQGTGFLKNTIKKGEDFMQFIKNAPAPINSTFTESNGQFKFWWYISDVSALKADGSIEITSSGKSDEKESAWDVAPLLPQLVNGWNQITLDFDKSNKTADGGADYKAINHFRIFFFTKDKTHEDLMTGIDDLKFVIKP